MFVYDPRYHVDIGAHVFPVDKYPRLYKRLTEDESVSLTLFIEPRPLTRQDTLSVHNYSYIEELVSCTWSDRTRSSELPINRDIVQAAFLAAGGTLRACEIALDTGWSMNLCGGFHHAFPDHAEGFCFLNDVAIAVSLLREQNRIQRALICDLDLHQGNGTAFIFQDTPDVFTFSMHQEDLYPVKQKSDLDIPLDTGVDDEAYLDLLQEHLPELLEKHRPQILVYVAGADPWQGDAIGSLKLSMEGLRNRDRFVIQHARKHHIPLAVVLGGGYDPDVEKVVQIHLNTCLELLERPT